MKNGNSTNDDATEKIMPSAAPAVRMALSQLLADCTAVASVIDSLRTNAISNLPSEDQKSFETDETDESGNAGGSN